VYLTWGNWWIPRMKMVYTLFILCALLAVVPALSKPEKVNELHVKPGSRIRGLGALNTLLKRPVKADKEEIPGTTEEFPRQAPLLRHRKRAPRWTQQARRLRRQAQSLTGSSPPPGFDEFDPEA